MQPRDRQRGREREAGAAPGIGAQQNPIDEETLPGEPDQGNEDDVCRGRDVQDPLARKDKGEGACESRPGTQSMPLQPGEHSPAADDQMQQDAPAEPRVARIGWCQGVESVHRIEDSGLGVADQRHAAEGGAVPELGASALVQGFDLKRAKGMIVRQDIGERAVENVGWIENDGRKDQRDSQHEAGVEGDGPAARAGVER